MDKAQEPLLTTTLTRFPALPLPLQHLRWARSSSLTRPSAFTNLPRCRRQRGSTRAEDTQGLVGRRGIHQIEIVRGDNRVSYRSITVHKRKELLKSCHFRLNAFAMQVQDHLSQTPKQILWVVHSGFGPATSNPSKPSIGSSGRSFAASLDCCAAVLSSAETAYSAR